MLAPDQRILILDFGSQYTQLIARRIRAMHVYCEIKPFTAPLDDIQKFNPSGLVLSGGPASVYEQPVPELESFLKSTEVPVLGICYGAQFLVHVGGGKVSASDAAEYGRAMLQSKPDTSDLLLEGCFETHGETQVWMSHGDRIDALPAGAVPLAHTDSSPFAVFRFEGRPIYGLQFHPEVAHTTHGTQLISNFVARVCKLEPSWTIDSFIETEVAEIQKRVGPNEKVICALSGGVDSSVVAALLGRAIPDRVQCIFVDHGLLRASERQQVEDVFRGRLSVPLQTVDASKRFLGALEGVTDPEEKRKIIGREFVEVFQEEAKQVEGAAYLAQGTLYPDVVESVSAHGGPSVTIKSHHNVGGLPESLHLKLLEPLRELFKDEVRELGVALGLPAELCHRQPFPGPGLAIRIMGEITPERITQVRAADAIFLEVLRETGWLAKCWQSFAVLLPVRSVGVMGDKRTYEHTLALRSVDSVDGMTADWSRLPPEVLAEASTRIINEVRGINRVVYDISSKPPATVEWE